MKIKSVYFYCLPEEYHGYQTEIITLAYGLKELGVPIFANCNYWLLSLSREDYLFKYHKDIQHKDCSVVVISEQYFTYLRLPPWGRFLVESDFPHQFFAKDRKYITVFVDLGDGIFTHAHQKIFRNFDIILKQKNKKIKYPDNCVPWVYGISHHMIEIINSIEETYKEKKIAVNTRNIHSVRERASELFLSKIPPRFMLDTKTTPLEWMKFAKQKKISYPELIVYQSKGRHEFNYCKQIKSSIATATFGGRFVPPNWLSGSPLLYRFFIYFVKGESSGRVNNLLSRLGLQCRHTYTVCQWDSWRLWESFVAGSVVLHLDFKKYGFDLPVMPENGIHYIGVDLKNVDQALEYFYGDISLLRKIGETGRKWALEHYAPVPTAKRFIRLIETRF